MPLAQFPPRDAATWIATVAGVGYLPWAPGTFGSLVGLLLFVPLFYLGIPLYLLSVTALTCLGVWASDQAERLFESEDDNRIVIDEVAGQLLTLTPLVALQALGLGPDSGLSPGGVVWLGLVVTGFVLFRWLDIRKPDPVRWAEQHFKGGLGVMADDVVAGLLGAIALTVPTYAALVFGLRELAQRAGVVMGGG